MPLASANFIPDGRRRADVSIEWFVDYAEHAVRAIDIETHWLELRGWITKNGKHIFIGDGGGSSGSGAGNKTAKKVDKSAKGDIIKPEEVSAIGKNELRKKGFPSKQKLNNHWQNGRTHAEEYKPDGITTKEQYEKRGVELAESAADGKKILGYKTKKEGYICRYDVEKNDYVKADINKGLRTLFKPTKEKGTLEGIDYYYDMESKEGEK